MQMSVSRKGEVLAQLKILTPPHIALFSEATATSFLSKKVYKALQVSFTVEDNIMNMKLITVKVQLSLVSHIFL